MVIIPQIYDIIKENLEAIHINAVLISILIVLLQISDTYLRYLAFSKKISPMQRKTFWRGIIICSTIICIFYFVIFFNFGITAIVYKLILIFGWIPFFIVSIKIISMSKLQHFFILGMSTIWTSFVHSLTANIDILFFEFEKPNLIFTYHTIIYLIFFIILLPVSRKFFTNLLLKENFFYNQPYGKYIVFIPFLIVSGVLILWIDNEVFHSWQERFSRLYLPFIFLLFYRYILTANRQIFENLQTIRYNQHLEEQISALEQYNSLMQKSQEQMAILRHDMRHNYRLIFTMLQEKKIDEVLKFIKVQENLLDLTTVKFFCHAPLVNAALSIYLQLAEKSNIKIKHKINLPEILKTDESDVAILISNLLENAINASKLQPKNRREISIIIEHIDSQCVLEIINFFDGEIDLKNNLPATSSEGHGIGMLSLKNFVKKYSAHYDFSHENCKVKIIIYWENI